MLVFIISPFSVFCNLRDRVWPFVDIFVCIFTSNIIDVFNNRANRFFLIYMYNGKYLIVGRILRCFIVLRTYYAIKYHCTNVRGVLMFAMLAIIIQVQTF